MQRPTPSHANLFHTGNTCPYCQETISEGQLIVTCPDCGGFHHDSCWDHNSGCASYICDPKVRMAQAVQTDIIITAGELENIIVPPAPHRPKPEEIAREYLPPATGKTSGPARLSVVVMILSLAGFIGVVNGNTTLLAVGMATASAAILLGIVSLVRTSMKPGFRDGVPAGIGVIASCIILMIYVGLIGKQGDFRHSERIADHQISMLPSEEHLEKMPREKSTALRANTVVKTRKAGFLNRAMLFGSGVVVKKDGQDAYVLTNKHVIGVEKAAEVEDCDITVSFYNAEESTATVAWLAPEGVDLAILSCRTFTLDKYERIRILREVLPQSSKVFAIGNPMNLLWTYTEGVISGIRKQEFGDHTVAFYQTQTPINQGNSGGGLYGELGELVGINTKMVNKSVSEGLNFSITTESLCNLLGERAAEFLHIIEQPNEDGL